LEKTYHDDRFKLTKDFDVSFKDANKAHGHVPDIMLGALSKMEREEFISDMKLSKMNKIKVDTGGYNSLDEGEMIKWDHDIDLEKEKSNTLNLLA
jgi:hypothetical protein